MTVVGVAGDVKQGSLDAATAPHTYEPFVQLGAVTWLNVAVRKRNLYLATETRSHRDKFSRCLRVSVAKSRGVSTSRLQGLRANYARGRDWRTARTVRRFCEHS